MRVLRASYCVRRQEVCRPVEGQQIFSEKIEERKGEFRAAARQTGILFRAGELVVCVDARVTPGLKELQVVLKTEEQTLKGWETLESLEKRTKAKEEREQIGESTGKTSDEDQKASADHNEEGREGESSDTRIIEETHTKKIGMKKVVKKGGKKVVKVSAKQVKKYSILPASDYMGSLMPGVKLQRLVKAASSYALGFKESSAEEGSAVDEVNRTSADSAGGKGEANEDKKDEDVKDKNAKEVDVKDEDVKGEAVKDKDTEEEDRSDEEVKGKDIEEEDASDEEVKTKDFINELVRNRDVSYEDLTEITEHTFDELVQVKVDDKVPEDKLAKEVPAKVNSEQTPGVAEVDDKDENGDDEEEEDSHDSESETTNQSVDADNAPNASHPAPSEKPRRSADFGSFRFALMQGFSPRMMYVLIQDVASPLPAPLGLLQEHRIRVPRLSDFSCSCSKQCNIHKFRLYLSGTGPGSAALQLTVWYRTWTPIASCNDVTDRFRKIFSDKNELPRVVRAAHPHPQELSYLFVGGFFTQHYPNYFEKNIKYLQEKLQFPSVVIVPIHTEGSIERNANDIRDSIMKECHGTKSIILIGHSKGGVDAIAVLHKFPDVVQYIFGIITFQAPFGGTFLIDYVARRSLALNTISNAIKTLLKGDPAAFFDMGYEARLATIGLSENIAEEGKGQQSSDGEILSDGELKGDDVRNDNNKCMQHLDVLTSVPIVSFASSSPFDVMKIRSAADVAGVAAMAPAAQIITQYTGFACDGLVTSVDARVPYADVVVLDDMLHTEPALYVKGTKYPPGQLTASGLVLLFEKAARMAKMK